MTEMLTGEKSWFLGGWNDVSQCSERNIGLWIKIDLGLNLVQATYNLEISISLYS
jgi:hypothetical protein